MNNFIEEDTTFYEHYYGSDNENDISNNNSDDIYKIKGIGLDVSNLAYESGLLNNYDYIHTKISSNNSFHISNHLTGNEKIFTTIDFLDGVEMAIEGHLIEIGRYNIHGLLIDARCSLKDYSEQITNLLNTGLVECIGISNPTNVDQLINANFVTDFEYISIDICPLNFNYEIITWAKEHGKKILGFNPFGGYLNAANVISAFTVQYLLNFISVYSDIVFLSSRDLLYSSKERDYLVDLMNRQYSNLYVLNKSMDKLATKLKKAIYPSLKISDNIVIPIENSDLFFNKDELSLNIENPETIIPDLIDSNDDELISPVLNYISEIHISKDATDEGMLSLIRYGVLSIIRSFYKNLNGNISITQCKLCNNAVIISVMKFEKVPPKNWIEKVFTNKTRSTGTEYILFYQNGTTLFKDIKGNDSKTSES